MMMNVQDVLVVTSVAEPTYRIYAHMAAALQVSTSALVGHVLTGVAPTLAAAIDQAEREVEGTVPPTPPLYGALVRGDMVMGGETRCALSTEAVLLQGLCVGAPTFTQSSHCRHTSVTMLPYTDGVQ
jgi:hypothetical protein